MVPPCDHVTMSPEDHTCLLFPRGQGISGSTMKCSCPRPHALDGVTVVHDSANGGPMQQSSCGTVAKRPVGNTALGSSNQINLTGAGASIKQRNSSCSASHKNCGRHKQQHTPYSVRTHAAVASHAAADPFGATRKCPADTSLLSKHTVHEKPVTNNTEMPVGVCTSCKCLRMAAGTPQAQTADLPMPHAVPRAVQKSI